MLLALHNIEFKNWDKGFCEIETMVHSLPTLVSLHKLADLLHSLA